MAACILLVSDVAEDDGELEDGETPAADDAEMEAGEDGEYEGAPAAFSSLRDHCALYTTHATSLSGMATGCEGLLWPKVLSGTAAVWRLAHSQHGGWLLLLILASRQMADNDGS